MDKRLYDIKSPAKPVGGAFFARHAGQIKKTGPFLTLHFYQQINPPIYSS